MQSLHENYFDSDNDRGATVQPYEDQASRQSGEQVTKVAGQAEARAEVMQSEEHILQPRRRSERLSRSSKQWWIVQHPSANIAITNGIFVPASYKQALRSAESEYWQAAIDAEYKSLQERQTWSLVVKPAGRQIVDSKWVFKVKRNSDGTIARF